MTTSTISKTKEITIEELYFSAQQAIVHFNYKGTYKEESIEAEKIIKWLKEYEPEYVKEFKYLSIEESKWMVNEVDMLDDFTERKALQKAFLKYYLNK